MNISNSIAEYAESIVRECDVDSTCILINDRSGARTSIFCLGNYGVDAEVLHHYEVDGICDYDPFTNSSNSDGLDDEPQSSFRLADDPSVTSRSDSEIYWNFVAGCDVEVIGAASMRLRSQVYLTVGAHRARRRGRRLAVPRERLIERVNSLQSKVSAHLLSSLIDAGNGYQRLMGVIGANKPSIEGSASKLSPRETEIAWLVCESRQNKEIAWLTSLSEYTVENHLRRIYQKLGIHNRVALVNRMKAS